MTDFIGVEEKNGIDVGTNRDFVLKFDKDGNLTEWKIKKDNIDIIGKTSFVDLLDNKILKSQLRTVTSSSIIHQKDFGVNELRKVYSLKEKSFIIDVYFISREAVEVSYSMEFFISNIFEYFMIGHDRFDLKETVSKPAHDMLLASDSRGIYLGCVFKEKAELRFVASINSYPSFILTTKFLLVPYDMFMISYTFSLV